MLAILVATLLLAEQPQVATGKITSSASFATGVYTLISESEDRPVLRVRGHDITLDFTGVKLIGSNDPTKPDEFKGVAIEVIDSKNVTIKNLSARGYKFAIVGRNSPGLHVVGCDFSYNYRQHLKSTPVREDESDWMSYHDNETDQWMRYGAAIYLNDCDGAKVERNTVHNGQNALMMSGCDDSKIWNNDFSFNSGVGIGFYRSSKNRILHNKIDWCVRGYSHGVYSRGQDSTAILVYEQSNENVFAYNRATHSGDGLFLWAGNHTMNTGEGGCNDNIVAHNDFSCAVANGIETTFSRNTFFDNLMEDCDYGIWGGYSFDSLFANNTIRRSNRAAIAIEHGQHNRIVGNTIDGPGVGIKLWANLKQDPNWGYPKHHDTKSHDYTIAGNRFGDNVNPHVLLRRTTDVKVDDAATEIVLPKIEPLPDGMDARLPADHPRGRKYIVIDEWGPVDPKKKP